MKISRLLLAIAAAPLATQVFAAEGAQDPRIDELTKAVKDLTAEVQSLRANTTPTAPAAKTSVSEESSQGGESLIPEFDPVQDDTVVISANRRATGLWSSPFDVEVIDADALRLRGNPQDIPTILRGRPGIDVRQSGAFSGISSVSIRGTNAFDTRYVVDGIPIEDASSTQGQFQPNDLPMAGLQGIEVLKGAQSGLYGSRAVGGVVSLQTIRPTDEHQGHLRLEGGSMNTYIIDGSATGPIGDRFGYAFALNGLTSEGESSTYLPRDPSNQYPAWPSSPGFAGWWQTWAEYSRAIDKNYRNEQDGWVARTADIPLGDHDSHEKDGVKRASMVGRVTFTPSLTSDYYVAAYTTVSKTQFDGFSPVDFDPVYSQVPDDYNSQNETTTWRLATGGSWDLGPDVLVSLDLSHGRNHRHFPHVQEIDRTRDFDTTESFGSLKATWTANEMVVVTAGVDGQYQTADFSGGAGEADVIKVWRYFQGETFGSLPYFPNDPWGINGFALPPEDAQAYQTYVAGLTAMQTAPQSARDHLVGAWGQVEISDEHYELVVTGRNDFHRGEGSAATFRVGGAYYLFERTLKFKGSVGTGFRAPSLYEQFSAFGNEDLKAQRSVSYDAGVEWRPYQPIHASAIYYRTDYQEKIDFLFARTPLGGSTGRYVNAEGDSRISGWEFALTLAPEDAPWQVRAYYNPQTSVAESDKGDRRLPLVPEKLAGIEGSWEWSTVFLTLGARYVGDRELPEFQDANAFGYGLDPVYSGLLMPNYLDEYFVVYGSAGWEFYPGFEATLRVENLTDEDYEETAGTTTIRPSAWVGLQASF